MARAGLGPAWHCLFANDIDETKAAAYRENWGDAELTVKPVADVDLSELDGTADLAWASFPCQDLSLAGAGAGLRGSRSGTFWQFWKLMRNLHKDGRGPRLIVIENVVGALHSHDGKDFRAIGSAIAYLGYRFGALVIDARHFLPQSRPRLFIVAVHSGIDIPDALKARKHDPLWHSDALVKGRLALTKRARRRWVWWRMPLPPKRRKTFADVIEARPTGVDWHSANETAYILGLMSSVNLAKVEKAKAYSAGKPHVRIVGGVYRRTRPDDAGGKQQRAEVRFDDVSGCLRTPSGGSSRQTILVIEKGEVRSRLLSPREAARLMGLPDTYKLPLRYNDAYHLAGDGLVVPVVRHLAAHVLEPILAPASEQEVEPQLRAPVRAIGSIGALL